jgi:hypothetical protein
MAYNWQRIGFPSYPNDFGDGALGDLEVTGTSTLTGDSRYNNLLVSRLPVV